MMADIAVIAGTGSLPRQLVHQLKTQGRTPLIIALKGQKEAYDPDLNPDHWVRLGAAGTMLSLIKQAGANELVIIGKVTRPPLRDLMPDAVARQILGAKFKNFRTGDNGLLQSIATYLADHTNIDLKSVQDFMPDLITTAGVLTKTAPNPAQQADIEKGQAALLTLSTLDVGQGLVIEQGQILGIEAIEGTDALITRTGTLKRNNKGPILVKGRKLGQNEQLDLPTIGLTTGNQAIEHGFCGLAIEAGGCLINDKAALIQRLDEYGLFLYAYSSNASDQ